ncbi:hypothetical protein AO398_20005 [Methylobacterium sp. GXS13]|uniref:hypothetical protein n=1 Tax=Methylobacterium sp. GXS13 TaxID=1730094 RepID=UPI00071BC380|nr:hypothetical protein [Methylobacterium sp. GXS13]KST58895.1 hypothetical protein AO398_20005 [Methylobacterium sp. GXS13]
MALAQFLPLTEAATFTLGCAVLHATRIDPERIAIVLVLTAAILAVALLIGLTPADLAGDAVSLDPANLWPRLL